MSIGYVWQYTSNKLKQYGLLETWNDIICNVWFDSLRPINNLSVKHRQAFLGWTSTKLGYMCLAQVPQLSDAGKAQTHGPSVWSQALYHWAAALPI